MINIDNMASKISLIKAEMLSLEVKSIASLKHRQLHFQVVSSCLTMSVPEIGQQFFICGLLGWITPHPLSNVKLSPNTINVQYSSKSGISKAGAEGAEAGGRDIKMEIYRGRGQET